MSAPTGFEISVVGSTLNFSSTNPQICKEWIDTLTSFINRASEGRISDSKDTNRIKPKEHSESAKNGGYSSEISRFLAQVKGIFAGASDYGPILVSYAREDSSSALARQHFHLNRITAHLRCLGFTVWLDIHPDNVQISNKVAGSSSVVLIATPRYVAGVAAETSIQKEFQAILKKMAAEESFTVFPLCFPGGNRSEEAIPAALLNHPNRVDFRAVEDGAEYARSMLHPESGLAVKLLRSLPAFTTSLTEQYKVAYGEFEARLQQRVVALHVLVQLGEKTIQDMDMRQRLDGFVAPFAMHRESDPIHERFDLCERLETFLSRVDAACFVVLGPAGSGKSMFAAATLAKYLASVSMSLWLPVFIPLRDGAGETSRCIDNYLLQPSLGLTPSDLKGLKEGMQQHRLLFILDACDDVLVRRPLLPLIDQLKEWPHAKALVFGRSEQYLPANEAGQCVLGEQSPVVIHLSPFTTDDIDSFCKFYDKKKVDRPEQSSIGELGKIPGMMEMVSNPLLLVLALQSLDQLQTNRRLAKLDNVAVRRFEIYRAFAETLLSHRGTVGAEAALNYAVDFCVHFACELFKLGKVGLRKDADAADEDAGVAQLREWIAKPRNATEFAAAPRLFGRGDYSFMHKSVWDFFVALGMLRNVGSLLWECKLLPRDERGIMMFLADAVKLDGEGDVVDVGTAKPSDAKVRATLALRILDVVYKSREAPNQGKPAGSNAISVLNSAGFVFDDLDLSLVYIPGADMRKAACNRTIFSGAVFYGRLEGVEQAVDAQLDDARLDGALFDECVFAPEVQTNKLPSMPSTSPSSPLPAATPATAATSTESATCHKDIIDATDANCPECVRHWGERGQLNEYRYGLGLYAIGGLAESKARGTALHIAARENKVEVVKVLLSLGVDTTIRTSFGNTPLNVAKLKRHAAIIALLEGADKLVLITSASLSYYIEKGIPSDTLTLNFASHVSPSDIRRFLLALATQGRILQLAVTRVSFDGVDFQRSPDFPDIIRLLAQELPGLTTLSMSSCNLNAAIMSNVALLTTVKALCITNNQTLATVPHLPPKLGSLQADGCPFLSKIPLEIRTKPDAQEFIAFLRDLVDASEPMYRGKVLFLGAGGVGKTELVDCINNTRGVLELRDSSYGFFRRRVCVIRNKMFLHISLGRQIEKTHFSLHGARIEHDDDAELSFQITPSPPSSSSSSSSSSPSSLPSSLSSLSSFFTPEKSTSSTPTVTTNKPVPSNAIAGKPSASAASLSEVSAKKLEPVSLRFQSAEEKAMWMNAVKRNITNTATDTVDIRQWTISADELKHCGTPIGKGKVASIDASVWDFAGQETYYEGHQFFLCHRSVYVIVLDLDPNHRNDTNGQCGRDASYEELRRWLLSVQALVGDAQDNDIQIIIAGNKYDLTVADEKDVAALRRIRVQSLVQDSGLKFAWQYVEVSARTGFQTDYLKRQIINAMVEQSHMGELVPCSYRALSKYLNTTKMHISEKNDQPLAVKLDDIISKTTLDHGVVTRLLSLLHHWSECVYFGADPHLRNIVFLDPPWLTRKVIGPLLFFLGGKVDDISQDERRYLQSQRHGRNGRHVTKDALRLAWSAWKPSEALLLDMARLLVKFSLLFPRPNNEDWFLPSAFPVDSSANPPASSSATAASTLAWTPVCGYAIKLDFLIAGIISQIVGKLDNSERFKINPDICTSNTLYATIPNPQKPSPTRPMDKNEPQERLVVGFDNVKSEISIAIERNCDFIDTTDYGCESLDIAFDTIAARLKEYTGLRYRQCYTCPECQHRRLASACKSQEDLREFKIIRKDDGVACVICSNQHEVPLFKWFADYRLTKCQQHGSTHHDYFISYRVKSEGPDGNNLSTNLCDALEAGGHSLCYLDRKCLQLGVDWKEGFLFGIGHSDVIIIILSHASIDIMNANAAASNHGNDNVLLEIIRALEYAAQGRARKVVPVLVEDPAYNYFDLSNYSNADVIVNGKTSTQTIADVMRELFKRQVVTVTPGDGDSIKRVVEHIKQSN